MDILDGAITTMFPYISEKYVEKIRAEKELISQLDGEVNFC